MPEVRIATRASRLARAQASWVAERLTRSHPGLGTVIVPITTTGDTDLASPIAGLSEVGAFVRAVQQAVLDGRADLAVHSLKDLPVAGLEGLDPIYPEREAPGDVLCGSTISGLQSGARVGTSSPRRAAQLRMLRDDLDLADIRGNVDTRLAKVESGEFAAVILAEAGLRRLGLEGRIDQRLSLEEMVPAPGQAALAIEGRTGSEAMHLAASLDHGPTRRAVECERRLLEITAAGCRSALGAYAEIETDGSVSLTAFVEDRAGPRRAGSRGEDTEGTVQDVCLALGI